MEESVSWAASLYCHGWPVGKVVISQDVSLHLPFGRNRASISNFPSLVFTGSQESWSRVGLKTQLQIKNQSQPSNWYLNWCPKHWARHRDPKQLLCWAQSCPPLAWGKDKDRVNAVFELSYGSRSFPTHLRPSLRTAAFRGWDLVHFWWHLARIMETCAVPLSACEDSHFSPTCLSSFPCPRPVPVYYSTTVSCKIQRTIWQKKDSLLQLC